MKRFDRESPVRFVVIFLALFAVFFYFNIFFFSITSHGRHYNAFIDEHFNYIRLLRHVLLDISAQIINSLGYMAITNDMELLVAGHGAIQVVYSCLGLGVMSFFAAFVIAYPKKLKAKLLFLFLGILCIQLLNILRFVLLAIFWNKKRGSIIMDHHTIFNIIIYVIIAISIYFWIRHDDKKLVSRAEN
ncbi:exosortase Y [Mucilaginibacter sp. McL0603]|uniref:exosortase Y n=1 Tax=Mucilaginibacter sp. McL0603 TaxID=3415670 RepID=UPI003CF8B6D7